MNDKIRKTLPLVGALALTSSALFAGAGTAFAVKPVPSISSNGSNCVDSNDDYRYYVTANLNDIKGKWTFLEATLHIGDTVLDTDSLGRVETGYQTVSFERMDGVSASITVDVVTRKGEPTAASVTTGLLDCPSGS